MTKRIIVVLTVQTVPAMTALQICSSVAFLHVTWYRCHANWSGNTPAGSLLWWHQL